MKVPKGATAVAERWAAPVAAWRLPNWNLSGYAQLPSGLRLKYQADPGNRDARVDRGQFTTKNRMLAFALDVTSRHDNVLFPPIHTDAARSIGSQYDKRLGA